jgi:hypothetical protein
MGYTFTRELGEMVSCRNDQQLSLRTAILHHLRGNCYPPIPSEMVEPCALAVEAYQDGDLDRIIETPYEHRDHGYEVPASAIVDACRLHGFIDALCNDLGIA